MTSESLKPAVEIVEVETTVESLEELDPHAVKVSVERMVMDARKRFM